MDDACRQREIYKVTNNDLQTTIAWMGQELLITFENEIGELALIPSDVGVFKVTADAGRLKDFD